MMRSPEQGNTPEDMTGWEEAGWERHEISKEEAEELEREMAEWSLEDAKFGLESLAHKLREPILEGRYTSILGDDTSGRIPALFVGHLMKRVAQEQGRAIPGRYFIAGGMDISDRRDALQHYIHEIRPRLGDRTLVVTEQFYTLASTVELAEILKQEGITFDVAAMESIPDEEDLNTFAKGEMHPEDEQFLFKTMHKMLQQRNEKNVLWTRERIADAIRGVHFYTGVDYTGAREFYKSPASGVEKDESKAVARRSRDFDAEAVREARRQFREFAEEVYEKEFSPELHAQEASSA